MHDLDFGPGTILQFRGKLSRGGVDITPSSHALDELNCEFFETGVRSRAGFDSHIQATGNWNGKALRVYEYKKRNEASRLLILDDTGKIWDSSTSFTTPILSIPAMTDFSAVTMFERAYISPHDGERGLNAEVVYVYDGSGVSRPAAGSGPSGYTLVAATNPAAGNVELGTHLFSVAFETISGHITKFGLSGTEVAVYAAPGGKQVDLSGIPTGGSSVVARWILTTKVLVDYDGNPADKEWWLFQRIPNNVDTTLAGISFFDADLVDPAERLLNQLATIPAGSCITTFGSRLVVGGERANDATARVSEPGEPESFSDLEGFVNVEPGDSGEGLRFMLEYRTGLYLMKDYRTYVTSDNGAAPSTWKVNPLDGAQGTSVHGSGGVLDSKGQTFDSFMVCTRTGLMRFVGTYGNARELTYLIEDDWKRITATAFKTIQIAIDPVRKFLVICVPLDGATTPSHIFYGDFNEGLEYDKMKWSIWQIATRIPTTAWIEVDFTSKSSKLKFGSSQLGLYVRDPTNTDDFGNAITSFYRPGDVSGSKNGGTSQFKALKIRATGFGTLDLTLFGLDGTTTQFLPAFTLATAPGRELVRLVDFVADRASLKFGVTGFGHWFRVTSVRLATDEVWETHWQT